MYSLFCQATSLNVCTDNHIPVCTFMAIVNSSKKRKGTSKLKKLQIKGGIWGLHKNYMRQHKDVQYTLLIIRCFMHSDQMRTNAMSKSMIQVLYCRAVSCCEMYCIGYSLFDNLVCSLFVHVGVLCCFALFVCLTLLASFFLPSHLSLKNMYCAVLFSL